MKLMERKNSSTSKRLQNHVEASAKQFAVLMLTVCCCQKTLVSGDGICILCGPCGDELSGVFLKRLFDVHSAEA